MNLLEFYPTPPKLIDKMLDGIEFKNIYTVLEPEAGAGGICDAINKKLKYARNAYSNDKDEYRGDIDCIEIDNDLRGILKNKNYRVVHDDFLTYRSMKKYDLIIMNPPFSEGDRHLTKAIEIQETHGGAVVCILNAETLKNPRTNLRKTLIRRLDELGAGIEYSDGEFENAERKTSVEIAMIKIAVPEKTGSLILDRLDKAKERQNGDFTDPTAVTSGNFINAIIEKYNYETDAGVNLIQEYMRLCPYMMYGIGEESVYNRSILKLEIDSNNGKENLINDYVRLTRLKYWRALFSHKEFTDSLPSNLQSELYSRIEEMENYEFSYHNIMEMRIELNTKTMRSIEDTILNLFDSLSQKHTWYDETSKNIRYFNGWKTNKAHKINKKVIMPFCTTERWDNKFSYRYEVRNRLEDIEKSLAFLDCGETPGDDISLRDKLDAAEKRQISQNIEFKYFKVTFYKKGTCHLTFKNDRLLEKFNIFGSQRKGWLPPCYGRKRKDDMTAEEKAVVDSFGGDYAEVMRDIKYYIVESGQFLLSASENLENNAAGENSGKYDSVKTNTDKQNTGQEEPVSEQTAESNENAGIDTDNKTVNAALKYAELSEMYEQLIIA